MKTVILIVILISATVALAQTMPHYEKLWVINYLKGNYNVKPDTVYITYADSIYFRVLYAVKALGDSISFDDGNFNIMWVDTLKGDSISFDDGNFNWVYIDTLTIDSLNANFVYGDTIKGDTLDIDDVNANRIVADTVDVDSTNTDHLVVNDNAVFSDTIFTNWIADKDSGEARFLDDVIIDSTLTVSDSMYGKIIVADTIEAVVFKANNLRAETGGDFGTLSCTGYSGIYFVYSNVVVDTMLNIGTGWFFEPYLTIRDSLDVQKTVSDLYVTTDSVDAQHGVFDIHVQTDSINTNHLVVNTNILVGGGSVISKFVAIGSHFACVVGTDTFWMAADTTNF